jgi:hypothetical protein
VNLAGHGQLLWMRVRRREVNAKRQAKMARLSWEWVFRLGAETLVACCFCPQKLDFTLSSGADLAISGKAAFSSVQLHVGRVAWHGSRHVLER